MKTYAYIILLTTLWACAPKEQEDNCLTLKVQTDDIGTSFHELFEQIEIIPLELNDNSLIKQIEELYLIDDTLYIFDRELKCLHIFDGISGKYLKTIMKVGQGPEEYTHVYDINIDDRRKLIEFLSPFGFINVYDYSGNFINREILPTPPNSYVKFKNFNDSTYIIWGYVDQNSKDLGNITLISKQNHQIVNSFWKNKDIEAGFALLPFGEYNNNTYFSISITNRVYQITIDECKLVYKWDLGKYNIDNYRKSNAFKVTLNNRNEKIKRIIEELSTSDNLYRFNRKLENDKYYYAQIVFKNQKGLAPHLFYNKDTGNSHYFFKTIEGLSFITCSLTDDYILAELLMDNKDDLLKSNLLNDSDRMKIVMAKDDDNPIIVKIYFKK